MNDLVQESEGIQIEQDKYPGQNDYKSIPDFLKNLSPLERKFIIRRLELNDFICKLNKIIYKYRRPIDIKYLPLFKSKLVKEKYPYLECIECKSNNKIRKISVVNQTFKCISIFDKNYNHNKLYKHKVYSEPQCQTTILCDNCLTSYHKCECGKYFILNDENKCSECLNWVTITVNIMETADLSFNCLNLQNLNIKSYVGVNIISINSSKLILKYDLKDYPSNKQRLEYRKCEYIIDFLFMLLGKKSIMLFMDGYSEQLHRHTEVKSIFIANKEYILFAFPNNNNNICYTNNYNYNEMC